MVCAKIAVLQDLGSVSRSLGSVSRSVLMEKEPTATFISLFLYSFVSWSTLLVHTRFPFKTPPRDRRYEGLSAIVN